MYRSSDPEDIAKVHVLQCRVQVLVFLEECTSVVKPTLSFNI